jgi:hypothetical protein
VKGQDVTTTGSRAKPISHCHEGINSVVFACEIKLNPKLFCVKTLCEATEADHICPIAELLKQIRENTFKLVQIGPGWGHHSED